MKHKDPDFPDAQYKGKSFEKEIATWRIPLYKTAKSNPLVLIGDSKEELPEKLKNEVYYMHTPASPKQTHR